MDHISAAEAAAKWGISPRVVRSYCEKGRVPGAFKAGTKWNIPANAEKPSRRTKNEKLPEDLLDRIRMEKRSGMPGGIYHKIQIDLTYNSNHIEGSRLTHDQTQAIFETSTVVAEDSALNVDDIIETTNHFHCVDYIIDNANRALTDRMIKQLHLMLKSNTSDSRLSWFATGEYKKLANEVGGRPTAAPEDVHEKMEKLLAAYSSLNTATLDDIIAFHYDFETIHPFQDGNGRIGRLIMFKECLHFGIVPFIIEDDIKQFYYRGLSEWKNEKGWLTDTCLSAQDKFKTYLDYFKISY